MENDSKLAISLLALLGIGVGMIIPAYVYGIRQKEDTYKKEQQQRIVGTVLEERYENTISPVPEYIVLAL